IKGARFDPRAIVKLVRPGFAEYEPVNYRVEDATTIRATFDLTAAPHGLYDVEVINPDGARAFAPYRYMVEDALPADVRIGLGGAGHGGRYRWPAAGPRLRPQPRRPGAGRGGVRRERLPRRHAGCGPRPRGVHLPYPGVGDAADPRRVRGPAAAGGGPAAGGHP